MPVYSYVVICVYLSDCRMEPNCDVNLNAGFYLLFALVLLMCSAE